MQHFYACFIYTCNITILVSFTDAIYLNPCVRLSHADVIPHLFKEVKAVLPNKSGTSFLLLLVLFNVKMKFKKLLAKGLETMFECIFSQSQAVLPDDEGHPNVEAFLVAAAIIMAAPLEPWLDKYEKKRISQVIVKKHPLKRKKASN